MKRTAVTVSVLLLLSVSAGVVTLAQPGGDLVVPNYRQPSQLAPSAPSGYEPGPPAAIQTPSMPATWQAKFNRVTNEIVELLDEEELEAEFAQLESHVNELKARKRLRSAVKELEGILQDHPGTEAAETAKALLQKEPEPLSDVPAFEEGSAEDSQPEADNNAATAVPPGQTLPSQSYLNDEIQYFAPGPELKPAKEAAGQKSQNPVQRLKALGEN